MKNSKLRNVTAVLAKILEVAAFFGIAICVILMIGTLTYGDTVSESIKKGHLNTDTVVNGYSVQIIDEAGNILVGPSVTALIAAAIGCLLMGLIFRNIYLIFKKSNTDSPFSKDNVRLIREIGIFAIAVPIVNVILTIVGRLIMGANSFQASVGLADITYGLVVLCLSQYFTYGAKLEKDVEGLL